MMIVWPYGAKNQNGRQVGGSVWVWSTATIIIVASASDGYTAPGGHMAHTAGGHMAHTSDPQHMAHKAPR
jgi:hypothetical protein